MKQIYLCSLVIILFILQSCTFEPKGEEYVTIDPAGKMPGIQINLNLATDTLYIPTNTTLTFAYGLNNETVNWAQFNVNGVESNQITIVPNMVSLSRTFNENPGVTYSLEMKIFAKSQTGSIADVLGAEGFMISRKWTIVIVSIPQLAPRITKTDFVDGTLKIEWEKYKGMGFTNYKIYKYVFYSYKPGFLLATINSKEQTTYTDTTYCGEDSQYYVVTNDTYQGSTVGLQGPIPVLTTETTANNEILFKWTKPPYYKNLKGYGLYYNDKSGAWQQMAAIPDITTESYTIHNPFFAHSYTLYLTPLPKTDNFYTPVLTKSKMSTWVNGFLGQTIPYFKDVTAGQGSLIYFLTNTQLVTIFDPLKLTSIKQFKYNDGIDVCAVSANDKYFVAMDYWPDKIFFEDLSDPAKSKTIDIKALKSQAMLNVSVSNVGTGCLMGNNMAVLYDFINERKLAEFNLTGTSSYSNKISASGNFFYLDTYSNYVFYQYKDNQTKLLDTGVSSVDNFLLDCFFIPGVNEKIVRAFRNRIEVLDCNTWTIEKKWLFPNLITHVYNFDIKSGKLLICENLKMVLFDVMNGTREELAPVDSENYYRGEVFYNNGYLFWCQGLAYKKN